jgi:hypothetical protein
VPVLPSYEDLTKLQWDYIASTLQTESQSGGRLDGVSWTDATGAAQTSSIVDVRRNTQHFFTDPLDPTKYDVRTRGIVGVQLVSWDSAAYASNRRYLVTEFEIVVMVTSVTHTVTGGDLIANGDDALAQAFAFVADGAGKGISVIFRDHANWTLGGNCQLMNLTRGVPKLEVSTGETPQMWASVAMTLRAEKPLTT